METLRRFPPQFQKEVFRKLESIVDIASLTKEERIKYDESIKVYRDNLAVMAYERKKGLEEGMEKGELKKQLEIALKMKKQGYLPEVISDLTGLSKEEIEAL